jgi:chemotaxis protein CheC
MTMFNLSQEDRDQLKELLNIGVSHAGTKLSQMASRRVAISVPFIEIKNASTVAQFVPKEEEISVAVLLQLTGGVEGYVLLYFPHHAAVQLLNSITRKRVGDLRAFDQYDRSVFQEVGNVLAGGMLSGLAQFLNVQLLHSVPDVVIDMSGAMFNSLSASMIATHDEFVSLDVAISVDRTDDDTIEVGLEGEAVGRMFLFLGPQATENILALTRSMVSSYE